MTAHVLNTTSELIVKLKTLTLEHQIQAEFMKIFMT